MKVEIKWYTHTLICDVTLCQEDNIENGFKVNSACLLNDLTNIIEILDYQKLNDLVYSALKKNKL